MVLAVLAAAGGAAASEAPAPFPAWMAGAWEQTASENRWADEYWTPPRGGMTISAARMGAARRSPSLSIGGSCEKADGTLSCFAPPLGRPTAEFPMGAAGGR
ncbi:DUF6265 family protein [Sphingopyxis sp.]|uniref:DUF6265 family protein n=1 Tax=Sphingopyxis sp. TaxID=1908224 RepID=UPI00345C28B0